MADPDRCAPEEIREQLSRILSSDEFRRAPSLGRLLTYLVDRALAGEQESTKEWSLAQDVFDRGDDFDPRDDTIVRVQARKLRGRLEEYFSKPRPGNSIRFVLPKGGYALQFQIIEIAEAVPSQPAEETGARTSRRFTILIAAASLVMLGAFAFQYFSLRSPSAASPVSSDVALVVTPFANLSQDKDNDYFATGLTEEITDALANLPGLQVVARASAARWKDNDLDFAALRELHIDKVVQGSVRKEGSRVRISIRLIDASSGNHVWSQDYDRQVKDSISTEQDVASAVAKVLKLKLGPVTRAAIATPNPDAYELYLKGRYYWRQSDAAAGAKGIDYLQQSIAIDPSFAPAYVALAGCYGLQMVYFQIPAVKGYAKVREMLTKALKLDDSLADAHTLLAGTYAWNDWNWSRAELEYREAAQLAPKSLIAHQYYASFLGALGRQTEAEEQMREAIRLDPLDTLMQWGEAQLMHWRGENEQAQIALNQIAKQAPQFALTGRLLADVDWALGKDREAEAVLRDHLLLHPGDPILLGQLGYAVAKAAHTDEARKILEQLQAEKQGEIPPQATAAVHLGLGENNQAIDDLWKAVDARTLRPPWLQREPVYAPLHSYPRWSELLHHANLQ